MSLLHDLNPGVDQTKTFLKETRRRALVLRLMECGALAAIGAAVVWLLGYALHRWGGMPLAWATGLAILALFVGAGALFLKRFPSRGEVVRAIDARLELKDRVKSSLEFMELSEGDVLHEWQIADTGKHLQGLSPERVFPWEWRRDTRSLLVAGALVGATLLLRLLPGPPPLAIVATPPYADVIAAQAAALEDDLEALEEALAESDDEDLQEVAERLEELKEQLEEEEGLEEAMELLGEMRQEMEEAAAALNTDLAEELMAEMGEALKEYEDTKAAGEKLEEGDYDAAAEEMKKLAQQAKQDAQKMRKRNKGLAEKLSKASKSGKGKHSESMQELSDALSGMEGQPLSEAFEGQAANLKNLQRMKGLQQMMQAQLAKLGECRECMSQCQKPGSKPGSMLGMMPGSGKGPGSGKSMAESKENSDSPSTSAGMGSADKPFGDATELAGEARDESLSGQHGSGPSQVMTEIAMEGQEAAGRDYKEVFSQYRKMSDEVLEQEALPAGYQAIIRDYFEAIRPTRDEQPTSTR